MAGTKKFVIYTEGRVEAKFIGAISSVEPTKEFKVYPKMDKIFLCFGKNNQVEITYMRVYSDFPPSISEFNFKEIKTVEELVSKKTKTV